MYLPELPKGFHDGICRKPYVESPFDLRQVPELRTFERFEYLLYTLCREAPRLLVRQCGGCGGSKYLIIEDLSPKSHNRYGLEAPVLKNEVCGPCGTVRVSGSRGLKDCGAACRGL